MAVGDVMFMTAAFGEAYSTAVRGLIRSFCEHHDPDELVVFSDQVVEHSSVEAADFTQLLSPFPDYYRRGERKNVFKFELFRLAFQQWPSSTVVWLDADSVVLAPLSPYLAPGFINVAAITQNPRTMYEFGNGMRAPARECASGNFYALPSNEVLKDIEALIEERLTWTDAEHHWSGDQVLLNHLIHRTSRPIHWIDGSTEDIFSVHFAFDLRQRVHHGPCSVDPAANEFRYGEQRIALLSHTKMLLDVSLKSGFREYPRVMRGMLRRVYMWDTLPPLSRVRSVLVWYMTIGAIDRLVQVLRRFPVLVRMKHRLFGEPKTNKS